MGRLLLKPSPELTDIILGIIGAFHARALRLREHAREIRNLFPFWAFPPQLPFNAPAWPGLASSALMVPTAGQAV
jgi:hypothetical protein